jgi:ketosteroid isomerase-like protein
LDDRYAINVAKTKLREAYSKADIDGILAIYSDSFTDMREGQASFFNVDAKAALRNRLTKLFREQDVELIPTIIGINISGDIAVEHGWYSVTQRPRIGGLPVSTRKRYVEVWQREGDLGWRLTLLIDNADHEPELLEQADG